MSRPDELVCPLTPRLKSLMDSLRSDLTAIGTDEASVSQLSVVDYSIMDTSWFTTQGGAIIERSERIAMKSATAALVTQEQGVPSGSFHSSVRFSGEPLDFRKHQPKLQKWDLAFEPLFDEHQPSGRSLAGAVLDAAAQAL